MGSIRDLPDHSTSPIRGFRCPSCYGWCLLLYQTCGNNISMVAFTKSSLIRSRLPGSIIILRGKITHRPYLPAFIPLSTHFPWNTRKMGSMLSELVPGLRKLSYSSVVCETDSRDQLSWQAMQARQQFRLIAVDMPFSYHSFLNLF